MKMKKRLLGILLSLVLILGLMPGMSLTAYAANYTNGQTVTFSSVAVGDTFEEGAKIKQDSGQWFNFHVVIDDYEDWVGGQDGTTAYTVSEKLTVISKGTSSISFDSERTYNLNNATVTVDTTNKSISVKVGDWNVASSKYDVKYGATAENATADFPTAAGSYYAFVTAKGTDPRFTGGTKSAAFTIAAASTDTQTSLSSTDDITVALSNVYDRGGRISGNNGSITFTSTAGKIKKIEIWATDLMIDGGSSGWSPSRTTLVWNGTAADSVTLSARIIDITGFSQIVYTLEARSDISDATVNVDTENESVFVTRGNAFIPAEEYIVKYGADAQQATSTEFPTMPGTYVAVVTANADSTNYTGSATSAEFTIASSHTHEWSYTAGTGDAANTITATCNGAGTCDITEGLTLTISAPTGNLVYDGTTTYPATLSTGYNTTAFPDTYSISYTKDGSAYSGVPKDAGTYTATVTAGTGDAAKTASVSYTIAQADSIANAPTGLTATYGQTLADVSLEGKNPEGNTPGTWAWADSTKSVGNVITPAATFKATFTPTSSNYKTVENVDVTVTVGKANAVAATVTANSRTYDGTEKPLVTVTGEATGGEMQYALGENATTAPADNLYTTSIPAKTDAGTYFVWYKVVGDENHNDTAPVCVKACIAKPFGTATFTLPAGTKTVGESAFENNTSITVVEIFSDCGSIGANAFKGCTGLTKIRIPASVTSIHATAFDGCTNVLVYGTANSAAQTYCGAHANCAFVVENTPS